MAYGPRFDEALGFAANLHREQVRKGSPVPYVTHLLAVAALVGENGGTEDEAIAALLHDAIEDQGGDVARRAIRERWGDEVVAIVDGCTDAETIPKPPWRERKETYLAHLANDASASVLLVSLADKLHNARCTLTDLRRDGPATWSKFTGGKDGTLWYLRALADVYRRRAAPTALREEFSRTLAEIERLASE